MTSFVGVASIPLVDGGAPSPSSIELLRERPLHLMPDTLRSRNYIALGLLIVGKLLGIGGLVVGSSSRVFGGTLLALDGIFIVSAIVVCVGTMKARAKQDAGQKDVLRQMMKEGTLKQYLRDLEEEQRSTGRSSGPGPKGAHDEDESSVARQTALS